MMSAALDDATRQRKELVDWFMRRNGPLWGAADERAFQHWMATPGNRDAYAQWQADWELADAMPQASVDRLRALVVADRKADEAAPRPPRHSPQRRRALGFAVAGVASTAMTGGWLGWRHIQSQPVYEQDFSTRTGQQSEIALPDGSQLRLDTATALKATFFRHRREIRFAEGQCMFSVTADAQRPFEVIAGPVRVTVVGTRFSVRLTAKVPGRDGVEVEVEEGRVRVARASGPQEQGAVADVTSGETFELTAGQQVTFDARGREPVFGTVAPDGIARWRNMQLSFSDVPLRQAVAEMERYGSLDIVAIDPAAAQLRLSGTFDPRDPAATRRLLTGTLPIKLARQGTGWEVLPTR
jgi:transmembrane sensor